VESQARGAITQAPPQAKNTESPGERGAAEGEAEKEEGVVYKAVFSTKHGRQSETYFHTIKIANPG
jgi:hypothetical protein